MIYKKWTWNSGYYNMFMLILYSHPEVYIPCFKSPLSCTLKYSTEKIEMISLKKHLDFLEVLSCKAIYHFMSVLHNLLLRRHG